jgi:hypothetical protein
MTEKLFAIGVPVDYGRAPRGVDQVAFWTGVLTHRPVFLFVYYQHPH